MKCLLYSQDFNSMQLVLKSGPTTLKYLVPYGEYAENKLLCGKQNLQFNIRSINRKHEYYDISLVYNSQCNYGHAHFVTGVFFSDGPFWVEQRRFTLRHLRDFGFGKSKMVSLIYDEIEDIVKELRDCKEFQVKGIYVHNVMVQIQSNI